MFQETSAAGRYPSVVSAERMQSAGQTEATSYGELLTVLWRRRRWIVFGTLVSLAAAGLFLTLATPRFTAVAQLLIDPNDLRVLDNAVTTTGAPNDANSAHVESQVRVLASDNVLRTVVEQQGLDRDPEFVQPLSLPARARDYAYALIGITPAAPQRDLRVVALQSFVPLVVAKRQERSYVVDLSVTTHDAEKSARLANAIVKAYLDDQGSSRADAAKRATDALSSRLQELKDRVRDAEDRSETYKAQNNIVASNGQLVNELQLTELTNQLTAAGAKADESKARLDQIERVRHGNADSGSTAEVVQSPTIAALRAQQAEVLRRKAELTAQLGERHPSVVDINAQARDVQQGIDREVTRLAQAAKGDYDRALATRQALLTRLDALKQESVNTSQAMVRLRELQREVEASRAVYQAFLVRSRETSEQERVNATNVRVLAEANRPDRRVWPPRSLVVLAAALAFGVATGAGLGFVRDWTDDRIYTRRKLETVCELPILCEIPPFPEGGAAGAAATILDAPKSGFAAGIQRLRYLLRATGPSGAPQTILFLAAGDAGARSDVAVNFALASATNRQRTLLIDADLAHRDVSSRVIGGNGTGLIDVAADRTKLEAALIAEQQTGLLVLQAGSADAADALEPVTPESVLRVLERARSGYTIMIDGPGDQLDPLGPALAAAADLTVLVVTAAVTRARDMIEFQRSTEFPVGKVRGVVLIGEG
jgi:polysaccharide biosynthesis transport protein